MKREADVAAWDDDRLRLPLSQVVEFAAFHYWRDYALDGGATFDTPSLAWFRTRLKLPFFGRVLWTRFADGDGKDAIDATIAEYARNRAPFRWYITPDTRPADLERKLLERGFSQGGEAVLMAIDLERLQPRLPLPEDVRFERVRTLEDRAIFGGILDTVFLPHEHSRPFQALEMSLPSDLYERKPRYLAFVDGQPAATAALVEADGVAGIYAVATLPAFRQRGLGALVTLLPLLEARERGLRYGILQASMMGEPVYRRIGFEPRGKQIFFNSPVQGSA